MGSEKEGKKKDKIRKKKRSYFDKQSEMFPKLMCS